MVRREMRVSLIGCGQVSRKHLRVLRQLPNVRITALCDRNTEKARAVARTIGVAHVYDDPRALLEEAQPNVVHILTPPQTHKDLAILAIQTGAHVLVEKPMALAVKDADAMIQAAERGGVKLCICHNFLWDPAILRARDLIARGKLGHLRAVEIYWRVSHHTQRDSSRGRSWITELRGGLLHEVVPHAAYLMAAFMDHPRVVCASASATDDTHTGDFDEWRVQLEGKTCLGTIAVSANTQPHQIWVRFYGSRSTIFVDLPTNALVRMRKSGENKLTKVVRSLDHSMQLSLKTLSNALGLATGRMRFGHYALIQRFYASLLQDTEPPVTGEAGRETVLLLEQIWSALNV